MQLPFPPRSGQKKPWGSIPRINRAHPLARGLVFYGYDTGAGLIVDLVSGSRGTSTAALGSASTQFGSGRNYTSGSNGIVFPVRAPLDSIFVSSLYSIACAWYITALPAVAFTCPFGINDAAANNAASFLWDAAGGTDMGIAFANNTAPTFTANTINVFHSLLATNTSATAQNIYYDGALKTTSALTATFATTTSAACFNCASTTGTTNNGVAGWVYYGALWNRTITAWEAALLHNDPWSLLTYPEDDMYASLVNPASTAVVTSSWGFEQANESNVFRTYSYKRGLIVPKEDGIISPFVNWQNVGSEIQPPPPPHIFRERRGAIIPKEDGTETPFVNWFNAGWEVQSVQPPHPKPERYASIMPREDGNETPFVNWKNFGWEIQAPQPPIPWKVKAWAGATAHGDDGSEARLVNFFPAGWEIQAVQPPHPFWEKRGSIMPREDGHESPLINFYPAGWEVQSIQPGHPRPERSGSIARGDDGSEATLINFYPTAWDQIGHWKYVRTREAMFGEDGTEFPLVTQVVTVTSGWGFDLQPYQPQYLRHPSGAIARIEDGNESPLVNFFPFNWEVQPPPPPHPRPERFGSQVGPVNIEINFTNFYPAGWEIHPALPRHIFNKQFLAPEDGIEAAFVPPTASVVGWGFDAQPHQPQHPMFKSGAVARTDDGNEFQFVGWYNFGWEIQSVQPNAYRTRPGIMPWEDGTDLTKIGWFNVGWETQSVQPPHPRPERFGAMAPWEDGIEGVYIFVPPPANNSVFRPLMGVGI